MRGLCNRVVGFVIEAVEKWPNVHRVKSCARFIGNNRVALRDGRTL